MAKFGPTFGDEIIAAGLADAITWSADEVFGRDDLTAAKKKKLDAVIAAHDATKEPTVRVISTLEFMERIPKAKRVAIRQAARENADLDDWLDLLRAAQEVNLDDPRTVDGVAAMVAAGLLTQAEADGLRA